MTSSRVQQCRLPALLAGLVASVALLAPAVGAAHPPPQCPETWNPAQQPERFTGVPGGWSTAPGTTNPSTPQNPDGFFRIFTTETPAHRLVLIDGCPGFGGEDDGGTGEPILTVESGTVVKYTEANGKAPGFEPMAANRQGRGGATYVDFHVWGQGDLYVCDEHDATACTCCYVPPPRFTPPPN